MIRWTETERAWFDAEQPIEWRGTRNGAHVATILRRECGYLVLVAGISVGGSTLGAAKRVAREMAR